MYVLHWIVSVSPTPLTPPAPPTFKVGLTQDEKKFYSELFKQLDPEASGIVTGEKARSTFEKSGLPPNVLGEIWQLADQNNLGFLSQFGFCYAMRLIGYTQAGHYPSAALAETPGPLPKFAGLALPTLSAQPTNNSLLQTQPSALIPQNTATLQSVPQENISPVSAADFQRFGQMFVKTTGSETALLDGSTAKDIFLKARLPTATLGQIWSLVDLSNRGSLELPAFVMAMHLIHGLLSGSIKQLPPFLPEHVWQSVNHNSSALGARQASYSSIASLQSTVRHPPVQQKPLVASVPEQSRLESGGSAESEWSVLAAQKKQMDSIFDSLDKDKKGALNPDQVANYLMTSRLDQHDLAAIWDLSDIQNTGIFSKLEFAIALFLVNRKIAGLSLPNVVPDSLIASLKADRVPSIPPSRENTRQYGLPQRPTSQPNVSESNKPAVKSSMDELADIFGSPSPDTSGHVTPNPTLNKTSTKSDLTHTTDLPKVRTQLTSSFKPTSTFGQSLLALQKSVDSPSLIGDDVPSQTHTPPSESTSTSAPPTVIPSSASQQRAPTQEVFDQPKQKTVDYEALRSVPPPPPKTRTFEQNQQLQPSGSLHLSYFGSGSPSVSNRDVSGQSGNSDLLADSEISGQLSEATSNIANISTQVKSLTTQTSNLHEKKLRADQELTRILAIKEDIENKLKVLRASYANEVKQVEQVEATLANAKEETEALRSEASITEAKLNNVSGELNEKQVAVEELQKTNSVLKEKLGILNAEIAEIQKQAESKQLENSQLEKEVSVRKSQLQVAIVKVDDLKSEILDLEASNEKYKLDIQKHEEEVKKAEEERIAAEKRAKELELHNEALKKTVASQKTPSKSSGLGTAVAATAAAAVGGAAGFAGAHFLGSSESQEESVRAEPPAESTQKSVDLPVQQSTEQTEPKQGSVTEVELPGALLFGKESVESFHASNEVESTAEPTIAGLVDEVQDKPTEDMTGLDDFEEAEHKAPQLDTTEFNSADLDDLKERYPEIETVDDRTNQTGSVSAVTDSYRQTGSIETPITSPDNSEYRYQAGAAGVVGGMVGMPGVLVGVQRTDSMTSSVQNNASLSVRDDNIDDVSERETLEDLPAPSNPDSLTEIKEGEGRLEDSEGERLSSGVELFEIVNADEARGLENSNRLEGSTHPLAQSFVQPAQNKYDEEFPPIQEFNYDESSSSEEDEDIPEEKFDDAVDHISPRPTAGESAATDEFDDDFNDLEPAVQEKDIPHEDLFGDEFNDLKIAEADEGEDFPVEQEVTMDDHFTGAVDGGFVAHSSAPDFSVGGSAPDANDEWEQLFAGFGNANTAQQPIDSSKTTAIDELVGMGFSESAVVEALEKENWNVEAATNYLLDNA